MNNPAQCWNEQITLRHVVESYIEVFFFNIIILNFFLFKQYLLHLLEEQKEFIWRAYAVFNA